VISGLSLLNDHAIWVCPGPEWGHDPNITMGKIMTNPWILGYPDPEIGYAVSPKYDHLNEVLMFKKKKMPFPNHEISSPPATAKNGKKSCDSALSKTARTLPEFGFWGSYKGSAMFCPY